MDIIEWMLLLKLSKIKQHQNSNHTGKEAYNFFMIAIFPTSQARILDYNRLIKDLYGYSLMILSMK